MPAETYQRAERRDGSEYVEEKLLSRRCDENGTLYSNINWADYEDPTRRPRDCIAEKLILRYYRRVPPREARAASTGAPHS